MIIKGLTDEDFVNYKKPAMFIATSKCSFKCEKECGVTGMCQNHPLATASEISLPNKKDDIGMHSTVTTYIIQVK